MEHINDCFEHIKVIRGVNNGRISNEQIENMIMRYQLDADEKEKLLELLPKKRIYPIPEEEFPNAVNKPIEVNRRNQKKTLPKEKRIEILDKMFEKLCDRFDENPERLMQYIEEIPILKRKIAEQRENSKGKSDRIIANALMKTNDYRNALKKSRDYRISKSLMRRPSCGTCRTNIRDAAQRWLNLLFPEDELEEIVQECCEEDVLSFKVLKLLLLFLDNTSK